MSPIRPLFPIVISAKQRREFRVWRFSLQLPATSLQEKLSREYIRPSKNIIKTEIATPLPGLAMTSGFKIAALRKIAAGLAMTKFNNLASSCQPSGKAKELIEYRIWRMEYRKTGSIGLS